MPTATTRTGRPRRATSRSTSAKKTVGKQTSPSAEKSHASKNGTSAQPEAKPRSTHRGSRGGRGRSRSRTPAAKGEEKQTKTTTTAVADEKEKAKTTSARRRAQTRSRKTSMPKAPEDKPPAASTPTVTRTQARKKPPRSRKRAGTAGQAASPRTRIPVTGAPSDEVPEPFAHNAEYEFARILDFYGIDWRYEPRSFPLRYERGHVSEAFTPDFYLPDLNLYVELTTVKPNLTQEKNRKMRLLRELYPEVNIILLKKRDYLRLLAKYGYGPLKPNQVPEVSKVLFSASKIQRRVAELGAQISHDYADSQPVLVGVLRGVMCFMADLMRNISVPASVDFMATSSYDGNTAGVVKILKDLDENIKGKDVILVEDIVDTGMTLNHVVEYLETKRPRSVKVCTLLDKRARRLANVPLDYVGFEIPDSFVVGYGLDFRQRFRNLPFIATLKHELLP